jgi:hypothetical protein
MNKRKSAQAVTAFLVVIARVFIRLLLIVSVSGLIPGGLISGKFRRDNLAWYNAPLGIHSFSANDTHSTVVFRNNMRDTVNISGIWIEDTYHPLDASVSSGSIAASTLSASYARQSVAVIIVINSSIYNGNVSLAGIPYHVR